MPKRASATPEPAADYLKRVGDRLAWVRKIVMPSQAATARMFHMDPATWNKWEKGTRLPSPWIIAKFCDTFQIPTDWIWRGIIKTEMRRDIELRLFAQHPEAADSQPEAARLATATVPAT